MATFHIEQFGCRATQADAAAIERQLLDRGYVTSPDAASADVIVVNTCTVTAAADAQSRQAIHAIHSKNPAAKIVATGCYAQRAPEELAALNGVTWVVGNSHKPEIPRLIEEMTPVTSCANHAADSGFVPMRTLVKDSMSLDRGPAKILSGNILEKNEFLAAPIGGGESGHTRPILKIQDGCDRYCSYCVIPQVRGHSRSLAPDRVMTEIRQLVETGAREIVLSGIDLGNYGQDLVPRTELRDLLRRALDETSVERLRVSSIEPMDVTADLIAIFAASDRTAHHFHMPMQSGSDRVLAMMRRWYRAELYGRRVVLVREWLPDAAIGADLIAGFPGETEDDHRATMALIEQLPLTYVHVFSFSARPGTPAADLPEQVPEVVIGQRARELRALGEAKKLEFLNAQQGRTLRVLTLNGTRGETAQTGTRAISGIYLDVRVKGLHPPNQFLDVRMAGLRDGHPSGVVLQASSKYASPAQS